MSQIEDAVQRNPWRALMPLDAVRNEDRDMLTLTREEELHSVNNMIAASRVSLIYAASGNGKTSLLNAGVVPFFQGRGYVVFTVRPRPPWAPTDPSTAFRACVLRQLPAVIKRTFDERAVSELESLASASERVDLKPLVSRVRTWVDALPDDPQVSRVINERFANRPTAGVHELMSEVADLAGRSRPILLILDQFEELFVHFSNRPALNEYAEQLAKLVADETMNVRLLFSMREDWVGSLIVLKRLIPELFRDSFRLTPITEKRADLILRKPLETRGYAFDPDARETLIDDLVADYERTEKRRIGRIAPDDGTGEHRYLDASALQLVASHLWETRNQVGRPFSMEHYRSLARHDVAKDDTPARQYLDTYLGDLLDRREAERRLQIDALYQLTDGERHRRASSSETISRHLLRVNRDAGLAPTAAAIRDALGPLTAAHVVRASETPEGVEYELAHDFVVRAVVKAWHDLEFERAKELGRMTQEKERKEVRLRQLEQRDDTVNIVQQIAPLVGIIGMIWSTIALSMGDLKAISFTFSPPGPGLLVYAAFIVLLAVGAIGRHRLSIVAAVVALVIAVTVTIITGGAQAKLDDAQQEIRRVEDKVTYEAAISEFQAARSFAPKARFIGTGLLAAGSVVLLLLFLRSAASLQSSERYARVLMIMWADFVDLLTYFVPVVIAAILASFAIVDYEVAVATAAIVFLLRYLFLVRFRSTPGLLAAGFRVAPKRPDTSVLAFRMHMWTRESATVLWTALNGLMLLPWLAVLPFMLYYRRMTVVDLVTRTVIEVRETPSAETKSAKVATATPQPNKYAQA